MLFDITLIAIAFIIIVIIIIIIIPASTLKPLQRVMHAAARLVCGLSPRDHVTSVLRSLNWLPVKQRIEFKLCLLVHQTINGRAPAYLKDLIETTASVPGRASNRSASNNDLVTRRTRLKLGERASPSLHHASGISCQLILKLLQTLKPSNENWKRFCSRQPTYSKTHNST